MGEMHARGPFDWFQRRRNKLGRGKMGHVRVVPAGKKLLGFASQAPLRGEKFSHLIGILIID